MRNLHAKDQEMTFSDGYDRTLYNLFMDGFGVFEYTIREVPRILKDYIARENKKIGEYDYYVMHQANQYILQQFEKNVVFHSGLWEYFISLGSIDIVQVFWKRRGRRGVRADEWFWCGLILRCDEYLPE